VAASLTTVLALQHKLVGALYLLCRNQSGLQSMASPNRLQGLVEELRTEGIELSNEEIDYTPPLPPYPMVAASEHNRQII